MKTNMLRILVIWILPFVGVACSDEWLEKKRDVKLIVPTTLEDLTLLLRDVETKMVSVGMTWLEASADDYYFPAADFESMYEVCRNAYRWDSEIFLPGSTEPDWDVSYYQVFVANVVLDALKEIPETNFNRVDHNRVHGSALFFRAQAMFALNQTFGPAFDDASADMDLGVPIDLDASVQNKLFRASIRENYAQILTDLILAESLLPDEPDFVTDPSKGAAQGLLSRIYLSMRDYENAEVYADKYLERHATLMDFNALNTAVSYPIQRFNVETVHYSEMTQTVDAFFGSLTRTPQSLFAQFVDDDLRKVVYFRDRSTGENGTHGFRGNYTGSARIFSGIATNEIYLNRAECRARRGATEEAMDDLNTLLVTRWKTGTFVPFSTSDGDEALAIILKERRKELMRRGLRWIDLKRLNLEPNHEVTLTREIGEQVYILQPNSVRYVLPIPPNIVSINGIQQNPR